MSPRLKNVASSEINYGKTGKKLWLERVNVFIKEAINSIFQNIYRGEVNNREGELIPEDDNSDKKKYL